MPSYAGTVCTAVANIISNLPTPPAQVVYRKFDSLLLPDKANANSIVAVVTESEEEHIACETFGDGGVTSFGTVVRQYLIGVTLYKLHAGNVQIGSDAMMSMALAIEQQFNKPVMAGAPTVMDVDLVPFRPFQSGGFRDGYEVFRMLLVVSSNEPRNG